jgi:hypothetical protein
MTAPDRDHAKLSASASHRWLNCTPSVSLEALLPDAGSTYAAEGTLAHSFAELRLRKYFDRTMKPSKHKAEVKKLQEHELYQAEMDDHIETYYDYIAKRCHEYSTLPHAVVEKRVDFSHIVPEGFGTADCIMIGDGLLTVVDFKYGWTPVSGERNPQMMLYALGALRAYELLYSIQTVSMAIVQPRRGSISEWALPIDELKAWGESIRETAQTAFEGRGAYHPGEWCRFCRAKSLCRRRTEYYTRQPAPSAELMTDSEIGQALWAAKELAKWAEDLEDYAFAELQKGRAIPGWKLVNSKGHRAWANETEAFAQVVNSGINKDDLYVRKPKPLTEVEKLPGKKTFEELLSGYITITPGTVTLAPDEDPRKTIQESDLVTEFAEAAQQYQMTGGN